MTCKHGETACVCLQCDLETAKKGLSDSDALVRCGVKLGDRHENLSQKAEYWLNDNVSGWTKTQKRTLITLLLEQDRDTRYACAVAVIGLSYDCETATGEDAISIDRASSACMNALAT